MNTIKNLTQKTLRPECGADAPTFLSAVYNRGTQAKKRQADVPQYGRSMIEMLGVLAIVGVLSVGGIAGYSKAMQKYRVNKTIEQVTQIINGVRTLYSQQKNYEGISTKYSGPIRKAKILPESAWESTASGDYPKNPFGGYYNLEPWSDAKTVKLWLYSIPDDACIELATQDWGAGEGLYAIAINAQSDDVDVGCHGKSDGSSVTGCAGAGNSNGHVSLPITMDKAIDVCVRGDNDLNFFFH